MPTVWPGHTQHSTAQHTQHSCVLLCAVRALAVAVAVAWHGWRLAAWRLLAAGGGAAPLASAMGGGGGAGLVSEDKIGHSDHGTVRKFCRTVYLDPGSALPSLKLHADYVHGLSFSVWS
eukprot:SAG25_NODE_256_length_10933_cov_24.263522_14_plen_119_part_00